MDVDNIGSEQLCKNIDQALNALEIKLQSNPSKRQLRSFLRKTDLPYLACYSDLLPISYTFQKSFQFLHLLGKFNVAMSLGLCMNQYIALTIAALPVSENSPLSIVKRQFLKAVLKDRLILAVSSFDDLIRNRHEQANLVKCCTQSDGSVLCNGIKNYQSNITDADVLLFTGMLDGDKTGLFYTFLNNTKTIELGEPIFAGAMTDSDTRTVYFHDHIIPKHQMVPAQNQTEGQILHALSRILFSVLAMAPYLGGASRALSEAAQFLKHVHLDGIPLAELDGYHVMLGKARIEYEVITALVDRFVYSLQGFESKNIECWMKEETTKVNALKYKATETCENLVSMARKIIGTRSMMPSHIISALSTQIQFAALHPVINAKIERELGAGFLREQG